MMLFRSFELQWTLSWFFLILTNFFGAFRDCYFWDIGAKSYVEKVWKDWHNVKTLEIAALIISARLIPIPGLDWKVWIPAFCWLLFRWAAWEYFMHVATMSTVYQGNKKWLGAVFFVNKKVAVTLAVIFGAVPYFLF